MRSSASAIALAALVAASTSRAHVVLENPKPFKWANDGHFNPINADGSDFPCKKYPDQTLEVDGERTVMAVGVNQTMSFSGQAVHGGGSCQIALTTDLQPTPESHWMVIHSIEGGCPARNQRGNLEESEANQDTYDFVIPDSIPTGQYSLSWTWINRISGSAEFYQNCAPITVVDGSASKSKRTSTTAERRRREQQSRRDVAGFPELFMANLQSLTGDCTTEEAVYEQLAIAYPNPGSSVERPEGDANLFPQPCDGNPRAGTAPAPAPTSAQPAPQPTASATVAPLPTTFPTVAPLPSTVVETPPAASTTTTTTATTSAPTQDGTAPIVPTATSPSVAPAPTDGACAIEGYLTCMDDGLGFKTCTGGKLRPENEAILIPPGYKCKPGTGVGLDLSPI